MFIVVTINEYTKGGISMKKGLMLENEIEMNLNFDVEKNDAVDATAWYAYIPDVVVAAGKAFADP